MTFFLVGNDFRRKNKDKASRSKEKIFSKSKCLPPKPGYSYGLNLKIWSTIDISFTKVKKIPWFEFWNILNPMIWGKDFYRRCCWFLICSGIGKILAQKCFSVLFLIFIPNFPFISISVFSLLKNGSILWIYRNHREKIIAEGKFGSDSISNRNMVHSIHGLKKSVSQLRLQFCDSICSGPHYFS